MDARTLQIGIELAIACMFALILWRVWDRGEPDPECPPPVWAQLLEKRIAHLQTAVFHVARRLESVSKNAATEPSLRVGDGPRPPRAQTTPYSTHRTELMSEAEIARALKEAAEADSQPHDPVAWPLGIVGTPIGAEDQHEDPHAVPTPRRPTPPRRR